MLKSPCSLSGVRESKKNPKKINNFCSCHPQKSDDNKDEEDGNDDGNDDNDDNDNEKDDDDDEQTRLQQDAARGVIWAKPSLLLQMLVIRYCSPTTNQC